jgi:hypothetical protein
LQKHTPNACYVWSCQTIFEQCTCDTRRITSVIIWYWNKFIFIEKLKFSYFKIKLFGIGNLFYFALYLGYHPATIWGSVDMTLLSVNFSWK